MRLYACITHVPVQVPYPDWVSTIHLGEAQGEGRLNLRDLAPQWVAHHPVIGGTAGSFALRALLERDFPQARSVGICQYRKFVSRERLSTVPAEGYASMDAVMLSQLRRDTLAQAMDPRDQEFLVVPPRRLSRHGLLDQYSRIHLSEDFLHFTAEAASQGVLDNREAAQFLSEQMFVPGGIELGVFPAAFWRESMAAIESVIAACVLRYPVHRDSYQRRVWSFCAERLGSHLLLRHFGSLGSSGWTRWRWRRRGHWSRALAGRLNLVTEDGQARYTIGT